MGTSVTLNINNEKLWKDYQKLCEKVKESPSSRISKIMEEELKIGGTK